MTDSPPVEPPVCLKCKHVATGFLGMLRDYPKCKITMERSVVTGDTERVFCSTARLWGQRCGPSGRLFEAR